LYVLEQDEEKKYGLWEVKLGRGMEKVKCSEMK
jgi:hypothetical protein